MADVAKPVVNMAVSAGLNAMGVPPGVSNVMANAITSLFDKKKGPSPAEQAMAENKKSLIATENDYRSIADRMLGHWDAFEKSVMPQFHSRLSELRNTQDPFGYSQTRAQILGNTSSQLRSIDERNRGQGGGLQASGATGAELQAQAALPAAYYNALFKGQQYADQYEQLNPEYRILPQKDRALASLQNFDMYKYGVTADALKDAAAARARELEKEEATSDPLSGLFEDKEFAGYAQGMLNKGFGKLSGMFGSSQPPSGSSGSASIPSLPSSNYSSNLDLGGNVPNYGMGTPMYNPFSNNPYGNQITSPMGGYIPSGQFNFRPSVPFGGPNG